MKRILSFMLFASLLVCTSFAFAEDTLPKPNELTEETIYTSQRLSVYDTIVIKDLTTDGAEYSMINAEEKAKIEAMKPMIIRMFSESLAMELKTKKLFKSVVSNVEPKEKSLILEGAITEFNAGSRALKFFVGFGAGKAYLKLRGRLLDSESGKELAVFDEREAGYRGAMSMESYVDLFPHQAKSLGENVGNFIAKLY